MENLVQQFELPVAGRDGELYIAMVHGSVRHDRRWEATIEFRRVSDGVRYATGVETTQPDWQAVLYWASGLGTAYFQGALDRATRPLPQSATSNSVRRLVDRGMDSTDRALVRSRIAEDVLDRFRARSTPQLMTQEFFDSLPYANADIVRTFEFLEKQERLVVRRTDHGNDWLVLTERGLRETGLTGLPHDHDIAIIDRKKPRG